MKLHSHLIALVIALLLPVIAFATILIYITYQQERAALERGMVDTARALSLAVDRELQATIRALQALATSEHLTSGNLGKFYRSGEAVIQGNPGWQSIALMDPSGQQIINLRLPFGTKLPHAVIPEVIKQVVRTKQPTVSNLFRGTVAGTPLIIIAVPVVRRGQVLYVLESSTAPEFLTTLLSQQKIPPDWTGTIVDNNHIIIARTRSPERYIGEPVQPWFVSQTKAVAEGSFRGVTSDAIPVYTAFSRSQVSGWTVALGIPAAGVEAPLKRTLTQMGVGSFVLITAAIFLAVLLGYRIARAAANLGSACRALGNGETPKLRACGVVELDHIGRELETAAVMRAAAEEALRLSEERYRLVGKATKDAIWDWDLITNKIEWNENVRTLFGYSEIEVGPDVTWWKSKIHPDDKERVLKNTQSAIDGSKPFSSDEYRFMCRNGSSAYVFDRGYISRDDSGKAVRMVGCMTDVTKRKQTEQQLRKSRGQLRALATYLETVREQERTRIARELHDEIGQALTAIKLSLEKSLRDSDPMTDLEPSLELINELMGRVRDLSLELRPAMLDDLGLLPALSWHLERYQNQFKVMVEFKHKGVEERRFAPDIETAGYRIVQEALTNIARHAGVDKVEVELAADEQMLRIRVKDQGAGFAPDLVSREPTGGLSGMRERAAVLGGRLIIESAPGDGTLLVAELPLSSGFRDPAYEASTWLDYEDER